MRYILKVVKEVERVYSELDREALYFKVQSGLKCPSGCSSCCTFKNIKASVLEMIPLAWHLYTEDQQDDLLQRLNQGHPVCALYKVLESGESLGGCLHYDHRALICRLFGNAGIALKDNRIGIYTCQTMKSTHSQAFSQTLGRLSNGLRIPMAQQFQTRLDAIDFTLASDIHPINRSIQKAMGKVSFHFRKRPPSPSFRIAG
jgi:hypothetical protein